MKKFSLFVVTALCAFAAMTSCSKNEGPAPLPFEQIVGEYAGNNSEKTLTLNYSGKPMIGKTVTIETNNTETAKLTIKGGNPLEQRSDNMLPGLSFPGVIAGETETVLNVELVNIDGTGYTFEGEDKNDLRTINYKGQLNEKTLVLDLEVSVNNKMAGKTLNLAAWIPNEDTSKAPESEPVYVNWKSTGSLSLCTVPFPFALPAEGLIKLALGLEIEGNPVPQAMLAGIFKSVTFHADGNITAEFKHELTDTEWSVSDLNVAQYYMKGDNQIFVVLNPAAILETILGQQAKADEQTPSLNIEPMLPGLLQLLPVLGNGIPLSIKMEGDKVIIYLDTTTCKTLFKNLLIPFLSDETNQTILSEKIKAAGGMAGMIDLKVLVPSLAKDIEIATEIELGINMNEAK